MNTEVLYEALSKHGRFFQATNGKIWFYHQNEIHEIGNNPAFKGLLKKLNLPAQGVS